MLIKTKKLINKNYKFESDSVPLRIWTEDWPLPKEVKFEDYSLNVNTSKKTNFKLNCQGLWTEIETLDNFTKRTYKEKNPKQWGMGGKSRRRFEYKRYEGNIWIKILSKSNLFGLENRKFYFDGKYLRMSLNPEEIAIWYLSGEGQVRFVILPKAIDINEELFELFGFLDGEMCKKASKKGGSTVKISNSEPVIITEILKRFNKIFRVPVESWTASITVNNKNSHFSEKDDAKLRRFWSEKTKISPEEFTKTTIQNKYCSLFSDKGIIQIRYSDSLFFNILLEIMANSRNFILKKIEYSKAYIRGVAAGEGGIGKRGDKLRIVHMGSTDEENKIFYTKCLKKAGITSIQKYKLRLEVCGLRNFITLRDLDIFKYIPYRKEKFLDALKNLKENYKRRPSQS